MSGRGYHSMSPKYKAFRKFVEIGSVLLIVGISCWLFAIFGFILAPGSLANQRNILTYSVVLTLFGCLFVGSGVGMLIIGKRMRDGNLAKLTGNGEGFARGSLDTPRDSTAGKQEIMVEMDNNRMDNYVSTATV